MAREKKIAKRVFFVRRNIDDVSSIRNTIPRDPAALLAFYEGEFYGSCGAGKDVCTGESKYFAQGWEIGNAAHVEASDAFAKAREAGKKSARIREEKGGTAQPVGGKGNGTRNGTTLRTPFGQNPNPLRSKSEPPSEEWDDDVQNGTRFPGNSGFSWSKGHLSEQESEGCSEGRSDY